MTDPEDVVDELLEQSERQTQALEEIADQLEIQNAALLSQAYAVEQLVAVQYNGNPADAVNISSLATRTEDSAMELAEKIDLDEVRRWSDR